MIAHSDMTWAQWFLAVCTVIGLAVFFTAALIAALAGLDLLERWAKGGKR